MKSPLPTNLGALLGAFLLAWAGLAVAKPPTLNYLFPAGGERGRTVEVSASGTFDRWPVRCWLEGCGVEAVALPKKGTLSITIAADASPGLHWLRLHDDEGATEARPFFVGTLPEVVEAEPNNDPRKAQGVEAPGVTVNGRLGRSGDVDAFAVSLRRGETLVASMEANRRLGSPIDGMLQVVSPEGFVLASSDDDHERDPQIVYPVPGDGRYVVRAFGFPATPGQKIALAGGESSIYRLTLTTRGFLDHVFPLAVSRDGPSRVESNGWNIPEDARTLPVVAVDASDRAEVSHPMLANEALVRLEPHATLVEAEPNGLEAPQPVPIPMTVTGRIDPARDRDVFRFSAKKGQALTIRVESRSLGHPLDPVLRLTDSARKPIAEVDDPERGRGGGRGAGRRRGADLGRDAELAFTAPRDDDYRIEVRDLYDHGGMRFVYRLSVIVPEPDYALTLAADRFTGTSGKPMEIPVTVERRNGFDGAIEVRAIGLPEGISSPPATSMPGGGSARSVTLRLTLASGPWSGPFRVEGKPSKKGGGPSRTATLPPLGAGVAPGWAWLTILKP